MVYLYDNAICDDLNQSLGSDTVRVIDPEGAVDIIAQIKDDNIKFPVLVVTRDGNYSVDTRRLNFTLAHKGIPVSIDLDTNLLYNERVMPIDLKYNITVLATNTADMDELVKELIFKYIHMFFLTIELPYESRRKLRFGVVLDSDGSVEQTSGSVEYMQGGTLYQAIIPLKCEGCVLVSYTPHQLHYHGLPEVVPLGFTEAIPLEKEKERRDIYNEVELQKYRNHN